MRFRMSVNVSFSFAMEECNILLENSLKFKGKTQCNYITQFCIFKKKMFFPPFQLMLTKRTQQSLWGPGLGLWLSSHQWPDRRMFLVKLRQWLRPSALLWVSITTSDCRNEQLPQQPARGQTVSSDVWLILIFKLWLTWAHLSWCQFHVFIQLEVLLL